MGGQVGRLQGPRSGFTQARPERVWQECTTFGRLAAWFGTEDKLEVYEPELGGQVLLSIENNGWKSRIFRRVGFFSRAMSTPCVNATNSRYRPSTTGS